MKEEKLKETETIDSIMLKTKKAQKFAVLVQEKAFSYILAGLGLVAGLAWNEAIKAAIVVWYPIEQDSLVAKFVYAGIVTILVVVASIITLKLTKKKEEEK